MSCLWCKYFCISTNTSISPHISLCHSLFLSAENSSLNWVQVRNGRGPTHLNLYLISWQSTKAAVKAAVLAFWVISMEHLYKASLMLGRKAQYAFKIILSIPFLAQKRSLNLSPLTDSQARIYPTDIFWGIPLGVATAAKDVTFNPAFIPPLGGIYPSLPWVKSPSLPHSSSWNQCWSLVHLASSLSVSSSHNTCSFYQLCFSIFSVIDIL